MWQETAAAGCSSSACRFAGECGAAGPVNYNYSPVYGLQEIGTGNYVVLKASSGSNAVVTGLSANTQYYVSAFELNENSTGPVFTSRGIFSFTTTGSGVTAPNYQCKRCFIQPGRLQ